VIGFFDLDLHQLNRLWVAMSPNVATKKEKDAPKCILFLFYKF